jgi:hypothetical protein
MEVEMVRLDLPVWGKRGGFAVALCALLSTGAMAGGAAVGFDGAAGGASISVGAALHSLQKAAKQSPAPKGADLTDPKYFTLDESSVKVEKVGVYKANQFVPTDPNKPVTLPKLPTPPKVGTPKIPNSGGSTIGKIGQIINIAERIWKIIEKNKPVVEVGSHFATAVPANITHWDQLQGWNMPETTVYRFHAKNAYGATMVDVTYAVLRTTGGNYNGKGKFLTGVTVMPISINVGWGYKLSMDVAVPSVSNAGSSEDPIAAMMANLNWSIETVVKTARGTGVYYVRGDGGFKEIASPFRK